MGQRNLLLEAAIDELTKAQVPYRYEQTTKRHIKLYVYNSPMIVLIGASHSNGVDIRAARNVRSDVRKAIAAIRK